MSYARFGWDDSDVYVYGIDRPTEGTRVECCCCHLCPSTRPENLMGFESHVEPDATAMIAHLRKHQEAGHCVPDDTFEELAEVAALQPPREEEKR